jgi:hypothetical protein
LLFALLEPDLVVDFEERVEHLLSRNVGSEAWIQRKVRTALDKWGKSDYDDLLELTRFYNYSRPILMHDSFELICVLLIEVLPLLEPENSLSHGHVSGGGSLDAVWGLVRLVYAVNVARCLKRCTREESLGRDELKMAEKLTKPWIKRTELLLDSLGVVVQGDLEMYLPSFHDVSQLPVTKGWYRHADLVQERVWKEFNKSFSSPLPLQLVNLPQRTDLLLAECLKFKCERCNTVPKEPALCLNCGKLLCSQSPCCLKERIGEASDHAISCNQGIGMFLIVNDGDVLLLNGTRGCLLPSPYLDIHGEADPGFKKGRPSFLNAARMQDLNKTWLTGQVPSVIARALDSGYNNRYHWQMY